MCLCAASLSHYFSHSPLQFFGINLEDCNCLETIAASLDWSSKMAFAGIKRALQTASP